MNTHDPNPIIVTTILPSYFGFGFGPTLPKNPVSIACEGTILFKFSIFLFTGTDENKKL